MPPYVLHLNTSNKTSHVYLYMIIFEYVYGIVKGTVIYL